MITVNINKAKEIAHEVRRAKRSEEFLPLDVKATIPFEAAAAEDARAEIRSKYEVIQSNIETASQIEELKAIVASM